jgi:hypothetical protein
MFSRTYKIPGYFGHNRQAAVYALGRAPGNWIGMTQSFFAVLSRIPGASHTDFGGHGHVDFPAGKSGILDRVVAAATRHGLAVHRTARGFEAIAPRANLFAEDEVTHVFWAAARTALSSLAESPVLRVSWRNETRGQGDMDRKLGWRVDTRRDGDDLTILCSRA